MIAAVRCGVPPYLTNLRVLCIYYKECNRVLGWRAGRLLELGLPKWDETLQDTGKRIELYYPEIERDLIHSYYGAGRAI